MEKKLTAAGEPAEKTQELLALLQQMAQMAVDTDHEIMEQVHKQLQMLVKYNLDTYVSEKNVDTVTPELERLLRCIEVKTTRLRVKVDRPADDQQPECPEQNAPGNKQSKLTQTLGLGAAIAAAAAAIVACFHVIRKGRKKE
jgi:hypothetical protein